MARKRHTAEELVTKLRQVDVLIAYSDEAGQWFRSITGHPFRFHPGRDSDLKPATLEITWVVVDVWFEYRFGSSLRILRCGDGAVFSHALAGQFDSIGVVDEAIEDGICDGGQDYTFYCRCRLIRQRSAHR